MDSFCFDCEIFYCEIHNSLQSDKSEHNLSFLSDCSDKQLCSQCGLFNCHCDDGELCDICGSFNCLQHCSAEHHCDTAVMEHMPSCLSPEARRVDVSRGNRQSLDTSQQSLTLNPPSTPPQNTQLVESTMAEVLSSPPSPLDTTPDQQAVMTIPGSVKTCVPVSVNEHADRQVPASPDSSCTPPPLENIKLKREVTKRLGRGAHSKSIKRCTPKKPQSKKKKLFKTTEPCPVAVIECLNCSQVGTIICDDCTYILKSKLLKFQIFRTFLKTLF